MRDSTAPMDSALFCKHSDMCFMYAVCECMHVFVILFCVFDMYVVCNCVSIQCVNSMHACEYACTANVYMFVRTFVFVHVYVVNVSTIPVIYIVCVCIHPFELKKYTSLRHTNRHT